MSSFKCLGKQVWPCRTYQKRSWSDCADQDLYLPLTDSFDNVEYIDGLRKPRPACAIARWSCFSLSAYVLRNLSHGTNHNTFFSVWKLGRMGFVDRQFGLQCDMLCGNPNPNEDSSLSRWNWLWCWECNRNSSRCMWQPWRSVSRFENYFSYWF